MAVVVQVEVELVRAAAAAVARAAVEEVVVVVKAEAAGRPVVCTYTFVTVDIILSVLHILGIGTAVVSCSPLPLQGDHDQYVVGPFLLAFGSLD